MQDQNGNAMQYADMYFYDQITAQTATTCRQLGNTNGCYLTSFQTGNGYTNSSGQFKDHCFFCSSCCSCTTTANQSYYMNNYKIAKVITYGCAGITIDGQ